ncbi:MAG: choice-of-anchor I family protein [Pseudomonadota bacterium]
MVIQRKGAVFFSVVLSSTLALASFTANANAEFNFTRLDAFAGTAGNAEIISFSSTENTVASTLGTGVELLSLSGGGFLSSRGIVDYSTAFNSIGDTLDGVSSVALDPLGRGFGIASLIPSMNGANAGKLGIFDFRAGSFSSLNILDVGFHPDSVSFSADGTKAVVANEGEYTLSGPGEAPGSVSVIDLSSVGVGSFAADIGALTNAAVTTVDFTTGNLGAGASIVPLRINDTSAFAAANKHLYIEPEYVTSSGDEVFVTLQENNGVAVLDLNTGKFEKIHLLQNITQTVDASDRDGPGGAQAALIDDVVTGMPMPDAMATFEVGSNTYYVTANEGDFRGDDFERERVKDLSRADIDDATEAALDAIYGDFQDDDALGRLRISNIDGNTDADPELEELLMPGTRSISIWNASTGSLVGDTGSLENVLLELDPLKHNINDGDLGEFDKRSDDKGAEPESVIVQEINGKIIAFVGLERQNGVLALDLTDPANISVGNTTDAPFAGYVNDLGDFPFFSPESLLFIAGADSPTGSDLLLVGFEEAGGGIAVYSVAPVPLPAAFWLMVPAIASLVPRRRAS